MCPGLAISFPGISPLVCGVAAVARAPAWVDCMHIAGGEGQMAQKVTVALEDDLDGGPAEETVRFACEGTEYEIDLSKKNAAAFHKQLAPFLEHARKSGRGQGRRRGRTVASG